VAVDAAIPIRGIVFGGSALIGTIIRNVGCILFEDCPHDPLIVDCPNTSAERPTSGTLCVPGAYVLDVTFEGSQ